MPDVLGIIIKKVIDTHSRIDGVVIAEKEHMWNVNSHGPLKSLQRYSWPIFNQVLDDVTKSCESHALSVLDFQRMLIPQMAHYFEKYWPDHIKISPATILRMKDTWFGPFMFRGIQSTLVAAKNSVTLSLNIPERLDASEVFLRHCVAGTRATLEVFLCKDSHLIVRSFDPRNVVMEVRYVDGLASQRKPNSKSSFFAMSFACIKSDIEQALNWSKNTSFDQTPYIISQFNDWRDAFLFLHSNSSIPEADTDLIGIVLSHVQMAMEKAPRSSRAIQHLETALNFHERLLCNYNP
jgi:hypothetical protein